MWDPAFVDKTSMKQQIAETRRHIDCPEEPFTLSRWRDWFARSFLLKLDANFKDFTTRVHTIDDLRRRIFGESLESTTPTVDHAQSAIPTQLI